MATGNVSIAYNVSGGPFGGFSFGPGNGWTVPLNAAVPEALTVTLGIGDNTIAIPAGTTVCMIAPPNMNTPTPNPGFGGTITYRTTGQGTPGEVISNKFPKFSSWDTAPASIILNASAAATLQVIFG